MATTVPTKRAAITIIERGQREVTALIDALAPRAMTVTTGIGGGAWSPADLIGHLAAWEGFALDALHAWGDVNGRRSTWRSAHAGWTA